MSEQDPGQGPVIRDKRRIDPLTGEVRQAPYEAEQAAGDPLAAAWEYDDQSGGQWIEGADTAAGGGYDYEPPPAADPVSGYAEQRAASAYADSAAYGQPVDDAWSREGASGVGSAEAGIPDPAADEVRRQLAERTADLQRLQAEYANYRRRVERDRGAVQEQALVNVLTNLLPLLDDVSRAREHGDLTGGFKSVGESLEATVDKLGLARFGEPGEPFDPSVHEALTHTYSNEVTEPTAVAVLQPGYRLGERVLRPARVAVAEPE